MSEKTIKVALVGMPGCGKTTIGSMLADMLGVAFVDLDEYIVKHVGKTVEQLFEPGEDNFRDVESQMLSQVAASAGKQKSIVVSTGGGIIKRPSNVEILKSEFIVIYINRSVEDIISTLDADSRPLLKNKVEHIYELYEQRHALYESCCSFEVKNEGTEPIAVVNEIMKRLA